MNTAIPGSLQDLVSGLTGDAELPAQFQPSTREIVADPGTETLRPLSNTPYTTSHTSSQKAMECTVCVRHYVDYVGVAQNSRVLQRHLLPLKSARGPSPFLLVVSNHPRKILTHRSVRNTSVDLGVALTARPAKALEDRGQRWQR